MKTILHVEDHATYAGLLKAFIEDMPVQLTRVTNAEDALAWLQDNPHTDLVISDFSLIGEMDGLGLLREIRNSTSFSHVRHIFLSAVDSPTVRAQAEALDTFAYLVKPSNAPTIYHTILKALDMNDN